MLDENISISEIKPAFKVLVPTYIQTWISGASSASYTDPIAIRPSTSRRQDLALSDAKSAWEPWELASFLAEGDIADCRIACGEIFRRMNAHTGPLLLQPFLSEKTVCFGPWMIISSRYSGSRGADRNPPFSWYIMPAHWLDLMRVCCWYWVFGSCRLNAVIIPLARVD